MEWWNAGNAGNAGKGQETDSLTDPTDPTNPTDSPPFPLPLPLPPQSPTIPPFHHSTIPSPSPLALPLSRGSVRRAPNSPSELAGDSRP